MATDLKFPEIVSYLNDGALIWTSGVGDIVLGLFNQGADATATMADLEASQTAAGLAIEALHEAIARKEARDG